MRVHDECLFVGVLFRDNAAAACFHLFRTMAADTGVQYDSDALDECISMLTVMNRLMYRQMSELFNGWEEAEGHRCDSGPIIRPTEYERRISPFI